MIGAPPPPLAIRRFALLAGRMMVIAMVLLLSISPGCKHETPAQQAQADLSNYQKRVREVVKDPAKADQLIALTNRLQDHVRQARAALVEYRAELARLNANYDATRADFGALFRKADADREALMNNVIDIRVQMGALTTDQEWAELRKAGAKALNADLQDLAS
jgi:septal ring factor EnvC (AmiA/AmiB activator)